MQAFLLVGLGGGIGAMGRYGVGLLASRAMSGFPLGTLIVNVLGSLGMGLLIGLLARFTPDWQADARLFAAIGLLGGFTTFSSFSLDVVALVERGQSVQALGYVLLSVVLSIVAVFVGLAVTRGA